MIDLPKLERLQLAVELLREVVVMTREEFAADPEGDAIEPCLKKLVDKSDDVYDQVADLL